MRSRQEQRSKPQAELSAASPLAVPPRCGVRPAPGGTLRVEISTTLPAGASVERVRSRVEGFVLGLATRYAALEEGDLPRVTAQLVRRSERIRLAFDIAAPQGDAERVLESSRRFAQALQLAPREAWRAGAPCVELSRLPLPAVACL